LRYELEEVDVGHGATHRPEFLALNPKGKVPTLVRDDRSVLTEFSAIATWVARQAPAVELLPHNAEAEARAVEVLAYVEGTIHGQGYGRLFAPSQFAPREDLADAVRQRGREIVERGFGVLDTTLAMQDFAAGERFTIADAALFYVERWAAKVDISLPPHVQRHFERLLARPAIERVREAWGEA
jgi:glutathione S-transferase